MISVYVADASTDANGREIYAVLKNFDNFNLTATAGEAEVVILPNGSADAVRRNVAYKQFSFKCVTLNDSDFLDYYIPSLYASNYQSFFSSKRALTCSPYSSLFPAQRKRNEWIDKLRDQPVEKKLLYSFLGGSTAMVRKRLFKHYQSLDLPDVHVRSTDHYKHWDHNDDLSFTKSAQQRLYVDTMRSSKFAVCPRGASPSSIRLFEAMELGVAPVVMADTWLPVTGLDWSFCIFVKERNYKQLDSIIRNHQSEWLQRGLAAQKLFNENFGHEMLGSTLERQLRWLVESRRPHREDLIHAIYPARQMYMVGKTRLRNLLRGVVLSMYRLTGKKFPYELNR